MKLGLKSLQHAVTSVVLAGAVAFGVGVPAAQASTVTAPSTTVTAPPTTTTTAGPGAPYYLALGDSVAFGYREPTTLPPPNYLDAGTFAGYPKYVGAALGLNVSDPACPGETSASFIAENVQSNGCENSPGGGPGYRSAFPLHVDYHGTQLQFAVKFLRDHPTTSVVSLMIGANDAFLCQETTADHCASELPTVLHQIAKNVADILSVIRSQANYTGQIVIVNYYSLDYSNVVGDAGSRALNRALDRGARPYGVQIADGYAAFKTAALHSGGNSCTAGLLTQLSTGGCGVHPSVAGQTVLALTVERVISAGATPTTGS